MKTAKDVNREIVIDAPRVISAEFYVVGESPIILNSMNSKVMRQLLLPKPPMNDAEKKSTLKHNPLAEFSSAPLRMPEGAATLLGLPATAFKGAMRTAALDAPGATKSQIGRLCYVVGENVEIFGTPQIHMSVTRLADKGRTPDIRTRCIVPRWAARFTMEFSSLITPTSIAALLTMGGKSCGVGDWRPEKGSGSFGRFRLVNADDKVFQEIVASGGRAAQAEAMEAPVPYDIPTAELLTWFYEETAGRGIEVPA